MQSFDKTHEDRSIDEVLESFLPPVSAGDGATRRASFSEMDNGVQHESQRIHLFNHIRRSVVTETGR